MYFVVKHIISPTNNSPPLALPKNGGVTMQDALHCWGGYILV
jgi:hypothetical protein